MAISLLTDSEKKAFEEVYGNTTRRIEAIMKKYNLDKVPDEITALRKQIESQRSKGRGLWQAIWHGFGVIKSEGDKLFKD